jgi:hypothetical protein
MGMSVVKKPKSKGETPVGDNPTPPREEEEVELNNVQWIDITTNNAYKINPGDEVIFKPLSELRPVKNNSAWIIDAFVYSWKTSDGQIVHKNENVTIYMQKVLAMRLQDALTKYGIGNFIVYAKNKGRQPPNRYYMYEVKIGVVKQ